MAQAAVSTTMTACRTVRRQRLHLRTGVYPRDPVRGRRVPGRRPDRDDRPRLRHRYDVRPEPVPGRSPDRDDQPRLRHRYDVRPEPVPGRRPDRDEQPRLRHGYDLRPEPVRDRRPDRDQQPRLRHRYDVHGRPVPGRPPRPRRPTGSARRSRSATPRPSTSLTAPNATTNRVCAPLTVCDTNTQYELTAPNATTNRVCATLTTCDSDQYESMAPTATTDRVCTDCGLINNCAAGRLHGHDQHVRPVQRRLRGRWRRRLPIVGPARPAPRSRRPRLLGLEPRSARRCRGPCRRQRLRPGPDRAHDRAGRHLRNAHRDRWAALRLGDLRDAEARPRVARPRRAHGRGVA